MANWRFSFFTSSRNALSGESARTWERWWAEPWLVAAVGEAGRRAPSAQKNHLKGHLWSGQSSFYQVLGCRGDNSSHRRLGIHRRTLGRLLLDGVIYWNRWRKIVLRFLARVGRHNFILLDKILSPVTMRGYWTGILLILLDRLLVFCLSHKTVIVEAIAVLVSVSHESIHAIFHIATWSGSRGALSAVTTTSVTIATTTHIARGVWVVFRVWARGSI